MKSVTICFALLLMTLTACHSPKTTAWICPHCGCKEGSGCGCSPENGCKCMDGKCQCS